MAEWYKMQAHIYKGYTIVEQRLADYFKLAQVPFDWQNCTDESIEAAFEEAESNDVVVPAKIREESVQLARDCPDQFSKEALATIGK